MTNKLINIRNINFSFAKNPIFTDFSYAFNDNEIITIVGNSGCGKSTLLNLITGLLTPASGDIVVSTPFSFLTQYITLLPYCNAYENALLACELRGEKTELKEKMANALFELFKLPEDSKRKFPQELSGGMKQRVGLIQALLLDTPMYLLDEPLKEIDRATGLIIQDYIWNKLKTNQSSAIIVTHDIEQSVLISDRIIFLSTNKPADEYIFDKDFSSLSPEERLKSENYKAHMLYTIKKLGEL